MGMETDLDTFCNQYQDTRIKTGWPHTLSEDQLSCAGARMNWECPWLVPYCRGPLRNLGSVPPKTAAIDYSCIGKAQVIPHGVTPQDVMAKSALYPQPLSHAKVSMLLMVVHFQQRPRYPSVFGFRTAFYFQPATSASTSTAKPQRVLVTIPAPSWPNIQTRTTPLRWPCRRHHPRPPSGNGSAPRASLNKSG